MPSITKRGVPPLRRRMPDSPIPLSGTGARNAADEIGRLQWSGAQCTTLVATFPLESGLAPVYRLDRGQFVVGSNHLDSNVHNAPLGVHRQMWETREGEHIDGDPVSPEGKDPRLEQPRLSDSPDHTNSPGASNAARVTASEVRGSPVPQSTTIQTLSSGTEAGAKPCALTPVGRAARIIHRTTGVEPRRITERNSLRGWGH